MRVAGCPPLGPAGPVCGLGDVGAMVIPGMFPGLGGAGDGGGGSNGTALTIPAPPVNADKPTQAVMAAALAKRLMFMLPFPSETVSLR